jgi:DNA polymerase-3 subunit beta
MRVTCSGLDLADAVGKVIKAVSPRTVNPILECIKIKAEADELVLTATDLELTIEKRVRADIEIEGTAVVPGKFLADYIRRMNEDQISLSLSERKILTLRYRDAIGEIRCFNEDEYPVIKTLENADSFCIQSGVLKDLIAKTIFSVASDDARPILKGCLLEVDASEKTITGVALDGYRMATCQKPIIDAAAPLSVIVPARSLNELHKLLEAGDEKIGIFRQRTSIMAVIGDTKVFTRLLDGEYLNYKQIIPADFSTEITVNKKQFEAALERASLVSRTDKNNLVKLDVQEKYLNISADSEIGKAEEKVSLSLSGKEIVLVFNVRYFLEALREITDDFVKIRFTRPESPCVINSANPDSEYLYLFLPIRVPR